MIKILSISFVAILSGMIAIAISNIFFPNLEFLIKLINFAAIGLLIIGISLIFTLIIDRYRDYKNEGDDYKKY